MRSFAKLLSQIEQTNSTNEKVDLMAKFFSEVDADTSSWALYFLSGQRPKKFIASGKLRAWAEEMANIPAWLAEDCYSAVGDTAEMIALVVAPFKNSSSTDAHAEVPIGEWMRIRLEPLKDASESVQKETIQGWWRELSTKETFVLNKLMTGALRIGVSETLVYRALSQAFDVPRPTIAARLLGKWRRPSAEFFGKITRAPEVNEANELVDETASEALPIPFCLAAPIEGKVEELGSIDDWLIEWKWDGIRAQVVKSGTKIELWSRGEERVTESFPDLVDFFGRISGDFTLDGEILAGSASAPGSFNDLQKRLGRKSPSATTVKGNPVSFLAYDYLREGTEIFGQLPLVDRRDRLDRFVEKNRSEKFGASPVIPLGSWEEARQAHEGSRAMRAEGLMVKKKSAVYATGRKRGIWFKWKVDPLTLDVVLTAAQPGTGRRASLYTDYTFGIWKGEQLVPIAKAYSGLSDEEIQELDQWIRKNTLDRFGPVRMLKPERVFEIGFEGVAVSARHKSGYAVRFPRILRERTDKPAQEADRVETVEALLVSLESSDVPRESEEPSLFSHREGEARP